MSLDEVAVINAGMTPSPAVAAREPMVPRLSQAKMTVFGRWLVISLRRIAWIVLGPTSVSPHTDSIASLESSDSKPPIKTLA